MVDKFLFKNIDNTGLVLFRIAFGFLITMEAFGAIATGWVKETLINPEFTFSFIGFGWIQPLPGYGMYAYFAIMGIFGILVMIGYRYRFSMLCYTILWTAVYLMQKSSYNNHYYLLMLLCMLMCVLPAHRWLSVDAKKFPHIKSSSMPRWCLLVIILQIWIVYTYAAIAKLYPDWLDITVPRILMSDKSHYWLVGDLLQQSWTHYSIAYTGILFDLLIVPLMLWKRTRVMAFIVSIFFHMFNSVIFHIGIFPYMSIAFAFFFFSAETLNRIFLPKKPLYDKEEVIVPSYKKPLLIFFSLYFIVQIALPVRHWFIPGNVLWTEEGHRLSWRMMLRTKAGFVKVTVWDKETGELSVVDYKKRLTPKQQRGLAAKPDFMWQFAQRLKQEYALEGKDIAVYFDAKVSVNQRPYIQFTDPAIDIAAEEWSHFRHHHWIKPAPKDLK